MAFLFEIWSHTPITGAVSAIEEKGVGLGRIAILGDGVSGNGVRKLLKERGIPFEVFDERGEIFTDRRAPSFSTVVYSPGFVPRHEWLKTAYRHKIPAYNEIDFASLFWTGTLVAVTGTNGKTSLAEWLALVLRTSGRRAYAVGNNGRPLSEFVAEHAEEDVVAVCEVSSYQSHSLRHLSPDKLLWTNFTPDHETFHRGLGGYFAAKWRLLRRTRWRQGEFGVYCGHSLRDCFRRWGRRVDSTVTWAPPPERGSFPENHVLFSAGQRENFALLRHFWTHEYGSVEVLEATSFVPPPHRLHLVTQIDRARFWNDSKSTNLDSLEKALGSLWRKQLIWIGGGGSKGEDLDAYVRALNRHPNILSLFLVGTTGRELYARLEGRTSSSVHYLGTVKRAVESCLPHCHREVDVLLSPGFSSLDQFKNYAERGDVFESEVLRLKNFERVTPIEVHEDPH
jgi:UDP-N-acetylmuramoylalanine--D-glutamate ligase